MTVAITWLGELFLFGSYGVYLFPAGNLAGKAVWTLLVCGVAMGATVACLAILFVADRVDGEKAVIRMIILYAIALGVVCNLLCLYLDARHFNYFGGADNPGLFFVSGAILAPLGGAIVGWAVFADRGRALLDRFGGAHIPRPLA